MNIGIQSNKIINALVVQTNIYIITLNDIEVNKIEHYANIKLG